MKDKDVRIAILGELYKQYQSDVGTKIVQEMGIWSGSVRIDIAVINGEMIGYELKSDKDTLDRLPLQAELYSRVFDKVNLVVGEKHADKAKGLIPEWWGIIVAAGMTEGVQLDKFRAPSPNPSPDPYLVAQLLWKGEAIEILEVYELAKGWRGKRIKDIHTRLATELPFEELAANVRSVLKRRQGWLGQSMSSDFNMPVNA